MYEQSLLQSLLWGLALHIYSELLRTVEQCKDLMFAKANLLNNRCQKIGPTIQYTTPDFFQNKKYFQLISGECFWKLLK